MAHEAQVMVGVLGPVAVLKEELALAPRSGVMRALLGVLAVRSPAPVPADYLIATVWRVKPPRDPKATLQLTVHRLRRWLSGAVGEAVAVRTAQDGYRLDLGSGTTDLAAFRGLIARAGDEPEHRRLATALVLWRGAPLADVPARHIDPQLVASLAEERCAAVRRCAAAALRAREAEAAVALLRPLCADNPLDEDAHALLIEALAAAGRRAAALGEFDRVRRRLATELGMEPGMQLRRIHRGLLAPERTGPPEREERQAARWRGPRPHVTLVGRERERAALADLLGTHRIVTVTGLGGVGKTVLALDVARLVAGRFPDGVVVVPPEAGDRAEKALTNQQALLVLDGCEMGLPPMVRRLAPGTVVLATSRQPLGISGEVVWRLEPLRTPAEGEEPDPTVPSVDLFLRRAAEAVPGFRPSPADLHHAARICRRLDGLPLALELASARLRTLPLNVLAERLAHDLGVLSACGPNGAVPRDSLWAAIDQSYRSLDPPERRLLARLSAYPDGFTLDAAEAACSAAPLTVGDVLPALATLVERSLVQPYDVPTGRRFRLLGVVREFAAERLAEAGEIRAATAQGGA